MEFYSKTDIGKVRKTNQDAIKVKSINEKLIWSLVCDGMGGANGGDVASGIAVDEISSHMDSHLSDNCDKDNIREIMYSAIQSANARIFEKAQKDSNLEHMGTTVVLCVISGDVLHIMYAGDSRVYLIQNSEIKQLSKDHSVVQEMIDSGEITPADAKNHPQKNIITRAVGVNEDIELDYIKVNLKVDDVILSCTDGLTNYLDEKDICKIYLNTKFSLFAEQLIKESNQRGGNDNISVSLVKV